MRFPVPIAIYAGLLSLGAACASAEVAPERVAAPRAGIAAAKEAGADENPQAALHLKLANDQFDRAKRMMNDGEPEDATRMLDRATVDAELALELARLDNTRRDAGDAMTNIQKLRQEHRMLKAE